MNNGIFLGDQTWSLYGAILSVRGSYLPNTFGRAVFAKPGYWRRISILDGIKIIGRLGFYGGRQNSVVGEMGIPILT